MRAGANGSSTPTCSSCAPGANQQPPRARIGSGFRQLLHPEQLPVEGAGVLLAAARRRDLHVVDPEDAHRAKLYHRLVAAQLEDTLVGGYRRLAAETPRRRIDVELRALDLLFGAVFGARCSLPVAAAIALAAPR